MDEKPEDQLRVEDAFDTVKYRVYPETPLDEVVDLMVRRGVRALPVVGEQYEVLGIITTGDALGHLLRGASGDELEEEGGGPRDARTARDVMTRAVLCVSEAQPLADAARMMVNRKVEQLPVVRDGELVGLITRDAVLGAIRGGRDDHEREEND